MLDIIVAEDDFNIRKGLVDFINNNVDSCRVVESFSNGSEALEYIKKSSVDIIISDVRMPGASGLDIAKYVYENKLDISVIIISAYRDFDYAKKAIDYCVCSYLSKPIMPSELREAIQRAQQVRPYSYVEKAMPEECAEYAGEELKGFEEKQAEKEKVIMERAIAFINENYHNDISLNDVAKYVYLSDHYFGSIFKRNKSEGFVKYLNSVRLKEAIRLLKTQQYTVKEISEKVGYRSSNYFIKQFKAYTNVTPKQYCLLMGKEIKE